MGIKKVNPLESENLLAQYKLLQEAKSRVDRELKDMRESLLKMKAGQYGNFLLAFETREVREYVVPARIDHIVKVIKI